MRCMSTWHLGCHGVHQGLHSFPTRRSSDLRGNAVELGLPPRHRHPPHGGVERVPRPEQARGVPGLVDRKSTRLNSSHGYISYAVFCLKKTRIACTNATTAALCPLSWRHKRI